MKIGPPTDKLHRKNLALLRDHLRTVPQERFNMRQFAQTPDDELGPNDLKVVTDSAVPDYACGAVCCAVGRGPAAGIEPLDKESWSEYCFRVFGVGFQGYRSREFAFLWLFDMEWALSDNSPTGAAERIDWYLARGVPDDYDAQVYRRAPLCYADKIRYTKADARWLLTGVQS